MGEAPWTSGFSPFGVFMVTTLPSLTASQAQPEPNWVLPASVNCAFISSTEPKASLTAFSSSPGRAPPPLGFIHCQKCTWL